MKTVTTTLTTILAVALVASPAIGQTRADATLQPMLGFGSAVVVTEDEIIVGRSGKADIMPMPSGETGGVHYFRHGEGGEWREAGTLGAEGVTFADGFGSGLARDGASLFVAAPGQNDGSGAVYAYRSSDEGWSEASRIAAPDGMAGDGFGAAMVVRGDLALIGAPSRGDAAGAVYVFRDDGERWAHEATLEGDAAGDRFGAAVALGDGYAAIGKPGPSFMPAPPGTPQAQPREGGAVIFAPAADGSWTRTAEIAAPAGSLAFGWAILAAHDGALISAPLAGNGFGAIYGFAPDEAGVWTQNADLKPASAAAPGTFGSSFAVAGEDLLVGAPFAGGGAGLVHVLRHSAEGEMEEVQQLTTGSQGLAPMFGGTLAASGGVAMINAPGGAFFEGVGYVFVRDDATGEWSEAQTVVEESGGLEAVVGGQVDCEDGRVGEFTCDAVDLVAFLPNDEVGAQRGIMVSDIWGWTDPESGKEYVVLGRFDGTSFIDISDPQNPRFLGDLPLHEGATPNLWRDMKVFSNHAFIVADNAGEHGVQVFDLTQLRDVGDEPIVFDETAHYDRIASAHNIVINEETGFAYTVGNSGGGETCGGGLHMIDINDPTSPTFAGCFGDTNTGSSGTGYTHDGQCLIYRGPDADYVEREICFNASETALGIADVTDKDNPVAISSASYPNVAYSHQGWISDDHRYFFLNDELDELAGVERTRTLVWDIEDLDDPILASEYMGETSATDHNLYVKGDLMYESNYVSGLRVIDVSDPENPVEVGHFDTVPWGDDVPGFMGAWSNYPYFGSGVIAVSSMREGLFLLKKSEPKIVS